MADDKPKAEILPPIVQRPLTVEEQTEAQRVASTLLPIPLPENMSQKLHPMPALPPESFQLYQPRLDKSAS